MSDPVDYVPFETTVSAPGAGGADGPPELERLYDVPVELAVEIGRTQMTIRETLALGPGSIVTLNRLAGEPVDLLVYGTPIARGEVVVIDRVRPARHRGRLERDRGAGRRARRRAGRRADRPAGLAAAAGSSTHSGGPDYAGLCAEPRPTTA
jgi:flagellar motor switch protein FliN